MTQYNSSKNKIRTIWNRVESNSNDISEINKLVFDFESINYNKKITELVIINKIFDSNTDFLQSIVLKNFPEWALSMINVVPIYSVDDAWNMDSLVEDFFAAFTAGTLKDGDISIASSSMKYWFNKVDDKDFHLKIFLSPNIRVANVGMFGFGSSEVPTYCKLVLKINNERIYETINHKKE